jgi:hypothetical protein
MKHRYIAAVGVFACLASAGAPAFATDDPPSTPTSPTSPTVTQPAPGSCVDVTRPRSRVQTSSRAASRKHVLRGTASDQGCSGSKVALVSVAVALKQGKRCRFVSHSARLGRASSCKRPHWLSAKGTDRWSLRLSKRMPSGKYQVLTRAVDSAGNVERAHSRRLALRRSRSITTK